VTGQADRLEDELDTAAAVFGVDFAETAGVPSSNSMKRVRKTGLRIGRNCVSFLVVRRVT